MQWLGRWRIARAAEGGSFSRERLSGQIIRWRAASSTNCDGGSPERLNWTDNPMASGENSQGSSSNGERREQPRQFVQAGRPVARAAGHPASSKETRIEGRVQQVAVAEPERLSGADNAMARPMANSQSGGGRQLLQSGGGSSWADHQSDRGPGSTKQWRVANSG